MVPIVPYFSAPWAVWAGLDSRIMDLNRARPNQRALNDELYL